MLEKLHHRLLRTQRAAALATLPLILRCDGGAGGTGEWAPTSRARMVLRPRGAKMTESEGDLVLPRTREESSGLGSFLGNLCAEIGRDIELGINKYVSETMNNTLKLESSELLSG